jgi:hypothetical protein
MLEGAEKLRKMREIVENELKHIPRGTFEQNMLRGFFQSLRMNSLGKNPQYHTKEEVLHASIAALKKDNPKFEPQYDKAFFKETKR